MHDKYWVIRVRLTIIIKKLLSLRLFTAYVFFFWVRKVISMSQLAVFLAIEKSVAILASYVHAICHFICLVVEIYMQRMTSSWKSHLAMHDNSWCYCYILILWFDNIFLYDYKSLIYWLSWYRSDRVFFQLY